MIQIRAHQNAGATIGSAKSPDAQLKTAGDTLTKNLSAVEEEIYQVRNQSGQDPLNFPIKINNRLASLLSVVNARRRPADWQRGADLQGPVRRAQGADGPAGQGPDVGPGGVQYRSEAAGIGARDREVAPAGKARTSPCEPFVLSFRLLLLQGRTNCLDTTPSANSNSPCSWPSLTWAPTPTA